MRILFAGSLEMIDPFGRLKQIAQVTESLDVREFVQLLGAQPYDVAVVDLEHLVESPRAYLLACKNHAPNLPVVVLGGMPNPNPVGLLESGATALLPAGCGAELLVNQARALMRLNGAVTAEPYQLVRADLRLELLSHKLFIGGKHIHMPRQEFSILKLLLMRSGQALSRETIISESFTNPHVEDRTVDVLIGRVRKILALSTHNCRIEAVWGVGYRLDVPA